MAESSLVVVGYSGHAFVVLDTSISAGFKPVGYFDAVEKASNPFNLPYLGRETDLGKFDFFLHNQWFVAIGDNSIRRKVQIALLNRGAQSPATIIHPAAVLSKYNTLGTGVLISASSVLQTFSEIGDGVICNTGCIIEHECRIGSFAHIAPGVVLCGNVQVGENSFVGAGSVVKPGVVIGKNAIIGAGSVVIRDVPDGAVVAGVPAKSIKTKSA